MNKGNLNKSLVNNEGELQLVKHRIHRLKDENIIIISENSPGWVILTNNDYTTLLNIFSKDRIEIKNLHQETVLFLTNLWKSDLLLLNDNTFSQIFIDSEEDKIPHLLVLKMTGSCNFQCAYCYDYNDTRRNKIIDFDLACQTIDFLLSKREKLTINFHGGEPLLQFDLMKKFVSFALEKAGNKDRIEFSIQTNGSLLNKEIIDFFDKYNFAIGISLDGCSEVSNEYRKTNSKLSALQFIEQLLKDFPDFISRRCGIITVVRKTNIKEIPFFAEWLQDKGFKTLNFSFLSPGGKGATYVENEAVSPEEGVLLFKNLVESIKRGQISSLFIRDIGMYIKNLCILKPSNLYYCGAASQFLYVDVTNEFKICDGICNDAFIMKSTSPGENMLNDPARNFARNLLAGFKHSICSGCPFFSLCGGGCIVPAIINNDGKPDMVKCEITKFMYKLLLEEFASTSKEKTPILNYYQTLCN